MSSVRTFLTFADDFADHGLNTEIMVRQNLGSYSGHGA